MLKSKILRAPKYLRSFKGEHCIACHREDETVVAAHIRFGSEGGMGLKPADNLVLPLCWECHAKCDQKKGEAAFWLDVFKNDPWGMMNFVKAGARERYREWQDEQ